jgi:hypothetical protein
MAGLDPAIHPFAKTFTKKMDPRVISASTRVFDALLPAGDDGALTLVIAGLDPAKTRYHRSSWPGLAPQVGFTRLAALIMRNSGKPELRCHPRLS